MGDDISDHSRPGTRKAEHPVHVRQVIKTRWLLFYNYHDLIYEK